MDPTKPILGIFLLKQICMDNQITITLSATNQSEVSLLQTTNPIDNNNSNNIIKNKFLTLNSK